MKSSLSVMLLVALLILGWGIGVFLSKAPIKITLFSALLVLLVIIFIKIEFGLLILLFLNPFSRVVAKFSNYALPMITSEIWNDLLLTFLSAVLVSKNIAERKKFTTGKIDTVIIIYILYAFALLVFNSGSGNIRQEILAFRYILEPVIVYWLTINIIKTRHQIKLYIVFILIGGLILALESINEIYTYSPQMLDFFYHSSLDSPFFNNLGYRASVGIDPNIHAYYLDFLILISFGLLMFIPSKSTKYFLFSYILLLVFSVLLTASRGGIIALVGGITFSVLVLTFIPKFSLYRQKTIVPISMLFFLCFGFIALQKTSESTFDRIISVRIGSESRIKRIQRYSREILPKNPFFGFGLSSAVAVKSGSVLQHSDLRSGDSLGDFADSMHTDYIRITVQMGFIGLAIYLWILVILIKMGFDLYRKIGKGYYKGLILGIIGFYMVFMLSSMTEPVGVSQITAFFFWFITGVVQVLYNQYISKPPILSTKRHLK